MRYLIPITTVLLLITSFATAQTKPATARPGILNRYVVNPNLPTLWIIGDSTVRCGHDDGGGNMWGWGTPLADYFDLSKINIQNRAVGGTSSRTFRSSGFWTPVLEKMKPGDMLMMQFGHNDASKVNDDSRARGTIKGIGDDTEEIDNQLTHEHEIVHTYGWYLRQFIAEAKAKGVTEIFICSPIPKNSWDNGHVAHGWNASYVQAAAEQAKQSGVHFIDLNAMASKRFEELGQQAVTEKLFHGKEVIHTDWPGAVVNAQCVVEGLRNSNVPAITAALLSTPPSNPAPPAPPMVKD